MLLEHFFAPVDSFIYSMKMSQEEKNKEVVKRLIEDCFNARDLSLLPKLLHEDFINHQDLLPVDCKKGPGVFKELYEKLFESFSDIKIHNHMMLADGDKVVIYDTLSGTNTGPLSDGSPPNGKRIEFAAFNILRLEDGKVIERWGITDQLSMMQQLGLVS